MAQGSFCPRAGRMHRKPRMQAPTLQTLAMRPTHHKPRMRVIRHMRQTRRQLMPLPGTAPPRTPGMGPKRVPPLILAMALPPRPGMALPPQIRGHRWWR